MLGAANHQMPCFRHPSGYPDGVLLDLRERLCLGSERSQSLSDFDFHLFVNRLVDDSVDNWRSRWYDRYQYHFAGIL